eukprot:scaffold58528_cov26-Tisochrysis_lutea.AAC.3
MQSLTAPAQRAERRQCAGAERLAASVSSAPLSYSAKRGLAPSAAARLVKYSCAPPHARPDHDAPALGASRRASARQPDLRTWLTPPPLRRWCAPKGRAHRPDGQREGVG